MVHTFRNVRNNFDLAEHIGPQNIVILIYILKRKGTNISSSALIDRN